MKFNTNLSIEAYGTVVEDIAEKYFDENGIYSPHVGKANAMCAFYNACVDKTELPEGFPESIEVVKDIELVAKNEEFISAYNAAIDYCGEAIDFANAYDAAMDIVNTKKNSLIYSVNAVSGALQSFVKFASENISPELIESIKSLNDAYDAVAEKGLVG